MTASRMTNHQIDQALAYRQACLQRAAEIEHRHANEQEWLLGAMTWRMSATNARKQIEHEMNTRRNFADRKPTSKPARAIYDWLARLEYELG